MKVWVLEFSDDGICHKVKLFEETHPPSIDRIMEVLTEWGVLYPETVVEVGEKFLRGQDVDFGWFKVSLTLEDVE